VTDTADEPLTIKEVASIMRISEGQVYRLMREGELPVIKRGKRFTRIMRSDLDAFLQRHRTESPQDIED